jgi:hypothetical protein
LNTWFTTDGSEVWVSDWATNGAVIVLDSATLAEIWRFRALPIPTGKFNVFTTLMISTHEGSSPP